MIQTIRKVTDQHGHVLQVARHPDGPDGPRAFIQITTPTPHDVGQFGSVDLTIDSVVARELAEAIFNALGDP